MYTAQTPNPYMLTTLEQIGARHSHGPFLFPPDYPWDFGKMFLVPRSGLFVLAVWRKTGGWDILTQPTSSSQIDATKQMLLAIHGPE